MEVESVEKPKIYFSGKVYCRHKQDMITAFFWGIRGREGQMIVHVAYGSGMNLYSFNKVSWCTGYDNKGQHFEKWVSCPRCYDNKT